MFWLPLIACFVASPQTVTVVNPDGTPAVAATVWVYPAHGSLSKSSEPVPLVADENGTVKTELVTDRSRGQKSLFVRDSKGRIGSNGLHRNVDEKPMVIQLVAVGEHTGRVVDEDGKPIGGATITPTMAYQDRGTTSQLPSSYIDLPPWESSRLAVRTEADGRFTLKGLPVGHHLQFELQAGERGTMKYSSLDVGDITVTHRKLGGAKLVVQDADPAMVKGLYWNIRAEDVEKTVPKTGVHPLRYDGGQHPGTAEYVIPNLVPGHYTLTLSSNAAIPYLTPTVAPFEVKAGENTTVTLAFKPTAKISGTITDPAGKGLPGVSVLVSIQSEKETRSQWVGEVTTITDGTFTAYGAAGWYTFGIRLAPDGFAVPKTKNHAPHFEPVQIGVGNAHTFAPLKLVQAVAFEAKVVDATGQPILNTSVELPFQWHLNGRDDKVTTGVDGVIRVKNLHPNDSINPHIRSGNAVNVPQHFRLLDHDKPVTIVVSEANAATVAGRVTDGTGKGIAEAKIEVLQWQHQYPGQSGLSTHARPVVATTDPEGRYHVSGLWPGDRGQIRVSASGYSDGEIPNVNLDSGKTITLPDIKLLGTKLSVAGVTLDTAGKPIAGAKVFAVDGIKPMETVSAADGTFTLTGFYDAPGFLFAEATDFRLIAVPVQPKDKSPVRVILRRTSEAPTPITISKDHTDADRRLTRHVLELMFKNHKAHGSGASAVERMATIDIETARKWIAEEKVQSGGQNDWSGILTRVERNKTLLATATEDVDEAVSILKKLSPEAGYPQALQLANQLLPVDKAKALQVMEEATVKARAMSMPQRVWYVASLGEWVAKNGNPTSGRKLIEEAMTLCEKLPADGRDRNSANIGSAAVRLAPFDWPRAKATIETLKDPSEKSRYFGAAAVQLAPIDLPKAKEVLKLLGPSRFFYLEESTVRMALQLARTNPDEAVRLVDGIAAPSFRIHGYVQVARELVTVDKPRAIALIDKAMTLVQTKPTELQSWSSSGGASGFALYVALAGQQVGHPDVTALTARALSLRTNGESHWGADDRKRLQVQMACGYALIDSAIGKQLLAGVATPDEFMKQAVTQSRDWLFALALCDPEQAIELTDKRMEWMNTSSDRKALMLIGMSELSRILTADDRLAELFTWGSLIRDVHDSD